MRFTGVMGGSQISGNITTPPPTPESNDNTTILPQQVFMTENYSVPDMCILNTPYGDEYCCNDGTNMGCYTLVAANSFWNYNLTSACPQIQSAYVNCS